MLKDREKLKERIGEHLCPLCYSSNVAEKILQEIEESEEPVYCNKVMEMEYEKEKKKANLKEIQPGLYEVEVKEEEER